MSETADKVVELAKEIFNIGYEVGVQATNVDCGVVWEERIDAIKAEITDYMTSEDFGMSYIQPIYEIIDKHIGGEA